jgi:hypothetical protein
MLAAVKSGEAAKRRDLRFQLLAERLSGVPQEGEYTNADMEWGTAHEAEALAAYEVATGAVVTAIGFCEHDSLLAGTSPDGFVGKDGILSIKCPKTATHIRYWRDGKEPPEHVAQNSHELWLTGRQWIDFVSYDPRLPESIRLFVIRVTRTPEELAAYEAEAKRFLAEVDTEYQAVLTMANPSTQLKRALA